jgi:hypothetical protein
VSAFADTSFATTAFAETAFDFGTGPAPEPDTSSSSGAGRSRRRRYEVEIDGQIFPVESVDHARALLEQARELALQKAPQVAQAVVEKRLHSKAPQGKPIRVPAPQLHTASDELAAIVIKARHDIARIYRQASLEAELRLRLQSQQIDDDEDDILMLL